MTTKKTIRTLFYAIASFCILSPLNAQDSATATNNSHLMMADSLFLKNEYKAASDQIHKALVHYKNIADANGSALCYNKLAKNHIALNELDLAQSYLDSTMTIPTVLDTAEPQVLGEHYYLQGYMANKGDDYKLSIAQLEKSLHQYTQNETGDDFAIAQVKEILGSNHYHLWNLGEAEDYFVQALSTYAKDEDGSRDKISSCYAYLSRIYTRSEQHSKALVYNKKTLALNRTIYGDDHAQVGLAHAIMAITYGRMVDFEKSLLNYEKANNIFISTLGEGHRWVVTTYENIGRAHNRMGNLEASLRNYEKAIALGKEHLGEDHLVVAHVYLNAADTYASMHENSKALQLYEKALEVQKKAYGEKHREVAQNYIAQGNFYNHIKDHHAALEKFDLVLNQYETEIEQALQSELILEEMNVLYKLVEAMEGKALTLKLLYEEEQHTQHIIASQEIFKKSQAIIEKMRLATTSLEDKMSLSSSNQVSLRGIIETNFVLSATQNDPQFLQEAFYYSELNRARVLQQVSQQNAQVGTDKEFKKLIDKEMAIKENKSDYLSKIAAEKKGDSAETSSKIAAYEEALFQINLQHDTLINAMQQKYPNYFDLEFGKNEDTIAEIQAQLDANTSLLEYFAADSNTTYVFLLTRQKFLAKRLNTVQLAQKVADLKQAIMDQHTANYKTAAAALYTDLVAPIADELVGDELIIVPDGTTWHINFELLLRSQNRTNNPKNFDYLLNHYAISYANAAGLHLNSKEPKKEYTNDMLAFSFSDSINAGNTISLATLRDQKDDLPGTRKEITEIAKLVNGDYYFGNQAREIDFKERAKNYKILHLALHGDVDHKNPQNSRLYFTKGKNDSEDNTLYGHELLSLDISADLVVLSACNTGTGKVTAGEGMMSLGNAFQFAGSKSLLMTHWEISDQVAPELMKLFYTNLKAGMNKSKALQQAKLTYITDSDAQKAGPFYWGSFYLVGDSSPIPLGGAAKWPYFLLGLAVLLGGGYWLRQRSKATA